MFFKNRETSGEGSERKVLLNKTAHLYALHKFFSVRNAISNAIGLSKMSMLHVHYTVHDYIFDVAWHTVHPNISPTDFFTVKLDLNWNQNKAKSIKKSFCER